VKALVMPRLDRRRAAEFERELLERARVWAPSWGAEDEGDFGRALLAVAARFSAEVAERFDRSGDKMRRGFLDWLGLQRQAAHPARLPVVLKMAAQAEPVLAEAPVRLQASADGATVVFETESDVGLVPGRLAMVVATDADEDAIYVQPPGLTEIEPPEAAPEQWRLKSFAAPGSAVLQVDPATGLVPEMLVEVASAEYRVVAVNNDLVTVDPPVPPGSGFATDTVLRKVSVFEPFDPGALDRQFHALYLGHPDLLNIEAAATIEVVGAQALAEADWHYWGKKDGEDEVGWRKLVAKLSPSGVALSKGHGAIEQLAVQPGKNARWIRASSTQVKEAVATLAVESLALLVNSGVSSSSAAAGAGRNELKAEALANTTPLVLTAAFYPLGRAPKQFDTFYLECDEAFSKRGALVRLSFELADPSFWSLAVVGGGAFANSVIAGVGQDGALHLYEVDASSGAISPLPDRELLQPPRPDAKGATPGGPPVALEQKPRWRPPVWSKGDDFMVGVSAGSTIWVWSEIYGDPKRSGWTSFGQLPSSNAAPHLVDGLVHLNGTVPLLVALEGGELFFRSLADDAPWAPVAPDDTGTPVVLEAIAPILVVSSGQLDTSAAEGLVAVASDGKLYTVSTAGITLGSDGKTLSFPTIEPHVGSCDLLSNTTTFAFDVRPVALMEGGTLTVIAASDAGDALERVRRPGKTGTGTVKSTGLRAASDRVIGNSLGAALNGGELAAIATVRRNGQAYVAMWTPELSGLAGELFTSDVSVGGARAGGAPTLVADHLIVPGERAEVFVAPFDLQQRLELTGALGAGVVLPASATPLAANDTVTRGQAKSSSTLVVAGPGASSASEAFYPLNATFPTTAVGLDVVVFRTSVAGTKGTATGSKTMKLAKDDRGAAEQSTIFIEMGGVGAEYLVTNVDATNPEWEVTLDTALPSSSGDTAYWLPEYPRGRVAPSLTLDPTASNQQCDADLVSRAGLAFPNAKPPHQAAETFKRDSDNDAILIVLGSEWETEPSGTTFILDATVGAWGSQLGGTASNPELSWEYWNGAWSKLLLTREETGNLKNTGSVEFRVPDDIAATDWAGKVHFWIRARLIGGDYGTETVTVVTEDLGGGKTKQTIDRSTEGIKPPSVVNLGISYSMSEEVKPTYVVTEDSGCSRDQSDANATDGALVEAFVPLSVSLGRLFSGAETTTQAADCPPECGCAVRPAEGASGGSSSPAVSRAAPVTPQTGRSILLGFDAPLSGDTFKVLLLVDRERDLDAFAPLAVHALVGQRFVPLVHQDETRALGESGVLTLSFPEPPTPATLFGDQPLRWIRLAPSAGAAGTWSPSLRGAYMNAVWARATETLTRELLGSSEGEPNLTVAVARPPVLHGSLELRIREPLSDEEREALRRENPDRVWADANLGGDWVLWDQVADPGDEDPKRRVYALDEASGEIRFGDGRHGRIPPVGRDSIVAFRYQRTEPPAPGQTDAPANAVAARSQLNLVTPVAGVEAGFSADHAAGGAPPESDERVLRFATAKLRHRGRAVTVRDLEDIALESSPDVAQARAIVRGRKTRLVVAMRGDDPIPRAAQRRELKRLLLAATPPSVDRDSFDVVAPKLRQLRVALGLQVADLDHAGAVAQAVKRRLADLLDQGTGGVSGEGWPLGEGPRPDQIAFALLDVPHLLRLASVTLAELKGDRSAPWPDRLAPDELVRLAPDGLRFQFDVIERTA